MNSDGSNQHEIITGHECKNATWSPDGRKIVFQETQESTTDGPFALYIMDFENPEAVDGSCWLITIKMPLLRCGNLNPDVVKHSLV